MHEFANEISRHVWQTKYKFVDRSVSERSIPILGTASHAFLPRSSVFLRFKKKILDFSPVAAFRPAPELLAT